MTDTLHHADVVVNASSSISIDAAAVGTPVVCVDFDAVEGVPYHASLTRFYDSTRQRPVVESGGVARVRPAEELVAAPGGGLEELVVQAGQPASGLLFARDGCEWMGHLGRLLSDPEKRAHRSAAARELIDRSIWADVQYPRFRRALFG